MIRVAILLTLFAPCAWAEDILKPTEKELALLVNEPSISPVRSKLADKFDNRLVQLKGYVEYKREGIPGIPIPSVFWAVSSEGKVIKIHWAEGTEKVQEQFKAKPRTVTIQGRFAISTTLISLTDVVVKP